MADNTIENGNDDNIDPCKRDAKTLDELIKIPLQVKRCGDQIQNRRKLLILKCSVSRNVIDK